MTPNDHGTETPNLCGGVSGADKYEPGPLPPPDLLVDAAQGFVPGWTESVVKNMLRSEVERETAKLRAEIKELRKIAQAEADDADNLRGENERLRVGLRFYANAWHFVLDDKEDFDSVSGEPQNWRFSGLEDSSTSIENGQVARNTLLGTPIDWIDGGEDETPPPIKGEKPAESADNLRAEVEMLRKAPIKALVDAIGGISAVLSPPGQPGSYARGHFNGMNDALLVVRAAIEQPARSTKES